ncbi:MAG: GLPGLI family protein [Microscillaceae bacterium]|nr:GLPGLI family protein [Microscillaceae bacterium]MDW8461549.1 GLPGLI family protein [Cytophagales bacterium]
MIKRILTVFICFLIHLWSLSTAQSILVEYERRQTVESSSDLVSITEVWITDSITTNRGNAAVVKKTSFVKKKKEGWVYDSQYAFGKNIPTKDSLHTFQWELLPDTVTILKYKCLSAKMTFRGRTYKVFYAPAIPISDGPWKLGGLPGLILEAKTIDNYMSWRAIKLDLNYKGKIDYVDVTKENYLTWAELVVKYKEIADKSIKAMHARLETEQLKQGKFIHKVPTLEIIYPQLNIEGIKVGN